MRGAGGSTGSKRGTTRRGAGISFSLQLACVLETGRHAVDRQLDEAAVSLAIGIVDRKRTQPCQEAYLDVRQRIYVWAPESNRTADERLGGQEFRPAGHLRQPANRPLVFVEDTTPQSVPLRVAGESGVQPCDLRLRPPENQLGVVQGAGQERPVAV